MLKGPRLTRQLKRLVPVPVSGVWYRSIEGHLFAGFFDSTNPVRPLWSLGAPRSGARFTVRNGAPSLYAAEDIETAQREALQVTLHSPVRPPAGTTRAVYTIEVQLQSVIDLRDATIQRMLGTTSNELAAAWRYTRTRRTPATQRLGRLAAKLGFEGLLFQSTKGVGACLVTFTDNLLKGSRLEMRAGSNVLEVLVGT